MVKQAQSKPLLWLLFILGLLGCNVLTTPIGGGGGAAISGPPVVQIIAPQPNATFLKDVNVNIQARISNAGKDINRVEIVVDGGLVARLDNPNAAGAPAFSIAQTWQAAGVGQHSINVTAFRADGVSSAPVAVNINVLAEAVQSQPSATLPPTQAGGQTNPTLSSGGNPPTNAPTVPPAQAQPTTPAPPTNPPPPAATSTPSKPTATFKQGANIRRGPSTLFNPPIGSIAAGQTADIQARTQSGEWYKISYYNGSGWVFAQLIDISGDTSQIAIDNGPPPPTLTPTPIPATPTPAPSSNLVAGQIRLDPAQPECKKTFNIFIDVANTGTTANASGGTLSVQDARAADGSNASNTVGAFGVIQPGQTVASGPIPLTVNTNFEEDHRIVIIVDSNNQVAETNENDNRAELVYRLKKGSC